ncbi:heavy metal-binding domain-containing protein [Bacteroidota bacterium]
MLNKIFSISLVVALLTLLIGVSSLNAQEMGKKEMMKKHDNMQHEMAAVDVMKADTNMDGKVYTCSMGCAVTDEAGRCPKCEMKMKEMSVEDAESMLKEKGFEVADHSKMKKACGPDCKKACCAKEEVSEAKTCAPGCEKACCAKTGEAVSDAKAFNKVCPMSGGPVDASVQTVSYNGKNYGFCNSGCVAHFQADPEKWSKNLSEDGKEFVASSM